MKFRIKRPFGKGLFFRKNWGGECSRTRPPPNRRGRMALQKTETMILPIFLDLKKIAKLGRNYQWPRPSSCCCGNPMVWGHGFVQVCFAGFSHPLEIRRYRCSLCGCVIRLRPKGYFARIQSAAASIRQLLDFRIAAGHWPVGTITNRCRHWLTALKRNAVVILGISWGKQLMAAFDRLTAMGRVPISRTI
jgi:hypothetical protein